MTYGCDTSFLLRILTNHPRPLATKVIATAYKRCQAGDVFVISDLVLAEAYYALQASYGVSKGNAIMLLKKISEAHGFSVSDYAKETLAIPNLHRAAPGFIDRLIHGEYSRKGLKTVACEKSFRKLPVCEVISE